MRAARLTGWRAPLEVVDIAEPTPPPGGVVLRVLACGVCRSDWHVWTGADPDVALPHVPGHEYCGEVIAVGEGVTRWQVGARVIAPFILACGSCSDCASGHQTICTTQALPGFTHAGAFAEAIAVPFADANLTALPEQLDPAVAAAMGCRVTTAYHALTGRAALQAGEWLAVFGAGGVGLSALMLARALGARVIMVDIVPEKLAAAKEMGAAHCIDARSEDPVAAIHALTSGGAHVTLEALGLPVTTANAIKSLRKLGRMVQVGMPAGDHTTMPVPMDAVYGGQLAVFGTRGMPSWRYPALLSLITATDLDFAPLITRRIALSEVTRELAAFDAPAPAGVAVITDFQN